MNHTPQPSSKKAFSLASAFVFITMVIIFILVLSAGFLMLGIKFEHYLHSSFIWVLMGLFVLMAFFWRLCTRDL